MAQKRSSSSLSSLRCHVASAADSFVTLQARFKFSSSTASVPSSLITVSKLGNLCAACPRK